MKQKLFDKWKNYNESCGKVSQQLDQAAAVLKQSEKQLDQLLGARSVIEELLTDEYGEGVLEELQQALKGETQSTSQVPDLTDEEDISTTPVVAKKVDPAKKVEMVEEVEL